MKVTYNNKTYHFKHHQILGDVYFESPITGELIKMTKPYLIEKYIITLTQHLEHYIPKF